MLRDAERAFVAAGLSDKLLRKGEGAAIVDIAREGAGRFFAEIARARGASSNGGRGDAQGKATIDRNFWSGDLLASYHKLDAALEALSAYAEARQTSEAVEVVARRGSQLRQDLATIVDGTKNHVVWAEVRARSAAIGASPIELSTMLQGRLFAQVPAVVLTSATLATGHSFKFLRSRLGLEGDDIPVEELEVASPFDYPKRALVYLPRDLPEPSDPAWLDAARARIGELIEATGGVRSSWQPRGA